MSPIFTFLVFTPWAISPLGFFLPLVFSPLRLPHLPPLFPFHSSIVQDRSSPKVSFECVFWALLPTAESPLPQGSWGTFSPLLLVFFFVLPVFLAFNPRRKRAKWTGG